MSTSSLIHKFLNKLIPGTKEAICYYVEMDISESRRQKFRELLFHRLPW